MRVSEAMTREVHVADPEETIQQAAMAMAGIDAGGLPVRENDRLVGMITDRDIAIRGVGEGKGPAARVRDVMTTDVRYCLRTKMSRMSPAIWGISRSGGCRSSIARSASWASSRSVMLP